MDFMGRKGWAAVTAVVAALALAVGMAAFQPWKLWVDATAKDADLAVPAAPAAPAAPGTASPAPAPRPEKLYEGDVWRSYSHGTTTGRVKLYRQPDGSHVLRLEDLSTSNGPDVKVVLSERPYDEVGTLGGDYLTLATLKGNTGDSNYTVPAGTDLAKYRSAVIWCKRFDAVFAAAALA